MPTIPVRRFRDIGAVVRAVRESRGITQEELAESLAFTRDYLRTLEQGKPTLHLSRLFRVLDNLGIRISITYALEEKDAQK
ncbi:MAG: helix-turn-helix domain-containing protein [Propionibacteriaceae bacterium]|jgi:transcriptional regulator with XRE-family HTH domain|nr:helix-turn-helix domain-containing protein [Propionibacteriaceae bacterium]